MNNKKITVITAALVALVAISGVAFSSFAYNDSSDSTRSRHEERRVEHELQHNAVEAAMDAKDYDAWVNAHDTDALMLEKINADNFPKLIEAHSYFEQGRALMEELGIEKGFGGCGGHGRMMQ